MSGAQRNKLLSFGPSDLVEPVTPKMFVGCYMKSAASPDKGTAVKTPSQRHLLASAKDVTASNLKLITFSFRNITEFILKMRVDMMMGILPHLHRQQ